LNLTTLSSSIISGLAKAFFSFLDGDSVAVKPGWLGRTQAAKATDASCAGIIVDRRLRSSLTGREIVVIGEKTISVSWVDNGACHIT